MACLTETKIKKTTHEALTLELGFTNMLHVDAVCYSGGVVMLWKDHEVDQVYPIAVTNQEIYANVQVSPTRPSWMLSLVYASFCFNNRKIL